MKIKITNSLIMLFLLLMVSCGGNSNSAENAPAPKPMVTPEKEANPMDDKGIGPVKSVSLEDQIDTQMAEEGSKLYQQFCTACHKPTEKLIGPAPKGILERRSPEWVMNMILNPEQMIKEDPIAKKLLLEANMAPMANQHLNEDQARKILEYFRTL